MSASSSSNDLRNRIIFTIAILAVYRFGTFIPLPGIDPEQLKIMMEGNQKGLLGMFNVFAGGAVSRMAIFALGIMPYISSSIIVQLLTGVSDYFKNLKAQGETGRLANVCQWRDGVLRRQVWTCHRDAMEGATFLGGERVSHRLQQQAAPGLAPSGRSVHGSTRQETRRDHHVPHRG